VPEAHYLETWSDVRAADGTVSIVQPLIAPLYDGKTAHEVLAAAAGREQTPYDVVRGYWKAKHGTGDFERWWRTALHDGLVADTALPAKTTALRSDWVEAAIGMHDNRLDAEGLELVFRLDPSLLDGASPTRLAAEVRSPSASSGTACALMSPATAARLEARLGGRRRLSRTGRRSRRRCWSCPVTPTSRSRFTSARPAARRTRRQRRRLRRQRVRASDALWIDARRRVAKTGGGTRFDDANHGDGRPPPHPQATLGSSTTSRRSAIRAREGHDPLPAPSLRGRRVGHDDRPRVVRRVQRLRHRLQRREQHPDRRQGPGRQGPRDALDRIDRYFEATEQPDDPPSAGTVHALRARPAGVVSVNAVHSSEGLNDAVYNRVGTKYCSNSCPTRSALQLLQVPGLDDRA
jgi:molybdopterin-containing oxidoreductase family iron-sulfur binding subunit